MQRAEAEEIREQLLELLDERQEAGPTDYVVQRATAEPDDGSGDEGEWSLVLVFRPTAGAALHGWRQRDLRRISTGEPVSPESMAWDLYGSVLEGGAAASDLPGGHDIPQGDDGIRWLTS